MPIWDLLTEVKPEGVEGRPEVNAVQYPENPVDPGMRAHEAWVCSSGPTTPQPAPESIGIPLVTPQRLNLGAIALIAQGNIDPKGASQFMNEIFDSSDYPNTLLDYSEWQQLIDGLYKVYNPPYLRYPTLT